ncbi:MAG: family 43 glycosylhydrolase, partial [Armatimonadetes bacterium]|nr:family 43 glycosylhydrolase [Armatimonadota bacterium]
VVFEDCVLVGPQCSLKSSNYGFHTYTYVSCRRCLLVTLNFSQPQGTPTDGIVQSVQEGKLLRVDFEDCTLMGYKVFGVKVEKDTVGEIKYSTRGDCRAYVQFQQDVPPGFHRLGGWPVEAFQKIVPPAAERPSPFVARELVTRNMCELSPFIWKGRLCHMECVRPSSGGTAADHYLLFRDAETGRVLGRAAEGYGLASIIVHNDTAYVFASRCQDGGWHDVTLFKSRDVRNWESKLVIEGENEQLFNTSVCKGPHGFVMAYESNDPRWPQFTIKFATSRDLEHWQKHPESTLGTNRYTACPCIRYVNGYYYVLYTERRSPRWYFETYVVRSKDLKHWEQSAANPVLSPVGIDESINASDPEIVEWQGKTYLYFAVGDQLTWMNIKRAIFPGPMDKFFEYCFRTGSVPEWGCAAAEAERAQRTE